MSVRIVTAFQLVIEWHSTKPTGMHIIVILLYVHIPCWHMAPRN